MKEKQNGQSMVEFAIILPVFLLMLLGVFEVGWALRGYLVLANVDREAARFASRGVYLRFDSLQPDPLCPDDYEEEGYCPGCVGATQLNVGYCKVVSHTIDSLSGQLPLDFYSNDPNSGMIITYYHLTPLDVPDTNCQALADPTDPNFHDYVEIEYPWLAIPSDPSILDTLDAEEVQAFVDGLPAYYEQEPPAGFANTYTSTTHYYRTGDPVFFSRINPISKVVELRAEANVHNCELRKKDQTPVPSNVIIVESYFEQHQLTGLPFITAFVPDPIPFYHHTAMRVSTSIREQQGQDDADCSLYPIIIPTSMVPSAAPPGTEFEIELAGSWSEVQTGKMSFVYWDPTKPPNLSTNLQNPDNAKFYKSPDPTDTGKKIAQFKWLAAYPGYHEADARTTLESLVGEAIWMPVWNDTGGCDDGPEGDCSSAKTLSTQAIQVFTFINMRVEAVDYTTTPPTITFLKEAYNSIHCQE